jgi:hypothetical protein
MAMVAMVSSADSAETVSSSVSPMAAAKRAYGLSWPFSLNRECDLPDRIDLGSISIVPTRHGLGRRNARQRLASVLVGDCQSTRAAMRRGLGLR